MSESVTVSMTVKVNGQVKEFSAAGDTGGSHYRLAQKLTSTVQMDAWDWCYDQQDCGEDRVKS